MRNSPLAPPYRARTIGMVTPVSLVAFESPAVTTAMPKVARGLHGLPLYALGFVERRRPEWSRWSSPARGATRRARPPRAA
jgi:hypothetical protein